MSKKVYLIIKEEDWYYDDKYIDIDAFEDLGSAQRFFEVYKDILLNDLRERFEDREDESYNFEDEVEIHEVNRDRGMKYVSIHMEEDYYIELYIIEKDIMSY